MSLNIIGLVSSLTGIKDKLKDVLGAFQTQRQINDMAIGDVIEIAIPDGWDIQFAFGGRRLSVETLDCVGNKARLKRLPDKKKRKP
jgi:hypothetical protein